MKLANFLVEVIATRDFSTPGFATSITEIPSTLKGEVEETQMLFFVQQTSGGELGSSGLLESIDENVTAP